MSPLNCDHAMWAAFFTSQQGQHVVSRILPMSRFSPLGPRIRGTQVKSSVRMKKTHESSKWLFLDHLIPEIESKAPN